MITITVPHTNTCTRIHTCTSTRIHIRIRILIHINIHPNTRTYDLTVSNRFTNLMYTVYGLDNAG
ncbi:hypothetical protein [Anaerobiospirillum sp. NML120449]|uniref:hypothetical protein n=1 Tax=Anaerobiospirillum sp. NML120449 TaxID=2932817 RepID=UPI001FF21434|nr:hypothetical protein [Anaerobiospirillum sp. NML120449]MCK0525776.1 hypothetical protein [Anaerobiospirillum sp. NML120449]